MNNIYMSPYAGLYAGGDTTTKVAAERNVRRVSEALVSGDPEKIASVFSDEDHAFWALTDQTFDKLASFEPLTAADVEKLSEQEIHALTVLGPDAPIKIAAYAEFFDSIAGYETAGRMMARDAWAEAEKRASEMDQNTVEENPGDEPPLEVNEDMEPRETLASVEVPDSREGRLQLLKKASEVLKARGLV